MTQRAQVVILAIQDAATHLIPNLPLLSNLRALGYRPIIVSGEKPRFRKRIEQLLKEGVNIEWASAGPNWSVSSWTWFLGTALVTKGNSAMNRELFGRYLTDPEANIQVAEKIVDIHKTVGQVRLVICDPSLAGGAYGAKLAGARWCVLENGLGRLMLEQHDNCRDNLDQVRRRLGLPAESDFPEMYTAPVLVATPKNVLHGDLGLDVRDFKKEMPYNSETVPSWVHELEGEPFFFGSNGSTGDYFASSPTAYHKRFAEGNELMIQAALRLGLKGVVSVGNLYDDFKRYTIPDHFEVVAHANQPELLKIAARNGFAWIHGGYGSISEYLPLGGPLVCFPGSTDQFSNCRLLEETGVGVYLRRSRAMDVLKAVRAMERVMSNQKYRRAALAVQSQCAALPALQERVLEVLEA